MNKMADPIGNSQC